MCKPLSFLLSYMHVTGVLTSGPLLSIQVEKLRLVCVTLLEVLQNCESVPVLERAKSHFDALLDVLSKLNSRVSEKLAVSCQS